MPSHDFDNALVVSSSKVIQDLIGRFLRERAASVHSAMSIEEATRQMASMDASSLLVLDADIDEKDGLELIESWEAAENVNRPAFVVITRKPTLELETRASLLGAIGLVSKPVSLPELSAILRRSTTTFLPAAQRLRARPLGEAVLLDRSVGEEIARWVIEDISESGAFLRSLVAYQPGTLLPIELHLGESRISVEARVIRSQGSPLQSDVRIGVHFELDSESRVALRRSLSELASSDRVEFS